MLSSVHNTNAIQHFLEEWFRLGAPHPKEFTCDGRKALIIAGIRIFTQYKFIEEYVEAFQRFGLPHCFIRMDAAHFIKLYVNCLSKLSSSRKVRVFYKAVLGLLIKCRQIETATKILKSILVVSQCDTDGHLVGTTQDTKCEVQKNFLKSVLDPNSINAK